MLSAIQAAGLMTIIAVVFTFIAGARVGALRGAKKIEAPATVGDPEFERTFRVHMNTIESLVVFLPLLWLVALAFDGTIALYIGLIWIVGRIIYLYERLYVRAGKAGDRCNHNDDTLGGTADHFGLGPVLLI